MANFENISMRKLTDFDVAYANALQILLNQAVVFNRRTGKRVRAAHGMLFQLDGSSFPVLTLRDIKPLWSCAEAVWFMGGGSDTKYMSKFGFKVWEKFADEKGFVQSATGHRWRSHFEVDQIKELVKKLTFDPTNRQGILMSWDPVIDNLNPGKNTPCVDIWHFHILEQRLHMSVLQRSGDVYFGIPHDILGSRIVQELLAAGLGVKPGGIAYLVSNAHLYEDQWPAAEEMLARAERMAMSGRKKSNVPASLKLTKDDFVKSMVCDEALPIELASKISEFYDPWPPISGPKLAL